jgi:hypothetical protein
MSRRARLDRLERRLPRERRGGVVVLPLADLHDADAVAAAVEGRPGGFLLVPAMLDADRWQEIAVPQQQQLAEMMRLPQ